MDYLLSTGTEKSVLSLMKFMKLNMYQRLRDFHVPAPVLDEIFANEQDMNILETAWNEMDEAGLTHDEIAREVADLILKEVNRSSDQSTAEK